MVADNIRLCAAPRHLAPAGPRPAIVVLAVPSSSAGKSLPRNAFGGSYSTYRQLGTGSWHRGMGGRGSPRRRRYEFGSTDIGGRRLAPSPYPRSADAALGASACPSARARPLAARPRTVRAWMADVSFACVRWIPVGTLLVCLRMPRRCCRPSSLGISILKSIRHLRHGINCNEFWVPTADADEGTQARPMHRVGERAGGHDAGWARSVCAGTALHRSRPPAGIASDPLLGTSEPTLLLHNFPCRCATL